MKALLTLAAVLAALAVAAPAALGAGKPQGSTFITDTLGGNGSPQATPDAFERYVASHTAQATPDAFERYVASHTAQPTQPQGTRFITDTLAPGGGASSKATSVAAGFSWADAGVGAGTAVGALLMLLGGSLLVARRQGRLAT
jgi:hypothetical protein